MSAVPKRPKTVNLDAAFAHDYEEFSFERDTPEPLELRPHVQRVRVKIAFRSKPFMTAVVEVAPVEAAEGSEHLPGHDLSTVGLDAPEAIPVLAMPWQIAQKLHAVSEPPLCPGAENARYWDLIDLQLLQVLAEENLAPIRQACVQTFAARAQQAWPPRITIHPDWAERYTTMATSLDMPITDVNEAVGAVHDFIRRIQESS